MRISKKITVFLLCFLIVLQNISFAQDSEVMILSSPAVAGEDGNLLINSGFEDGTNSWSLQGTGWEFGSIDKETTPNGVHSGDYSAHVPVRAGGSFPYQIVQLEADKTYIASVAVKLNENTNSNAQTATLYVSPLTSGAASSSIKSATLNSEWGLSNGLITTTGATRAYVGVAQWTGVASFYVDDFYFGELAIGDVNIIGESYSDIVSLPKDQETKTVGLSAEILNQLGTTKGLEDANVSLWELTEEVDGAYIDEATGELTLESYVEAETLGVRVTIEPDYAGAPSEPFVFEKTLKVIPYDLLTATNMLVNSGFENGTASWQKQGSWDFESVSKAEEPDNVYAGDYAALVPVRAATAFPYQTVQLEADKTYISSVAIKLKENTNTNTQLATLYLSPQNGCGSATVQNVSLTDSWAVSKGILTTTANGSAYVGVAQWTGVASFYIDDAYFGELTVSDIKVIGEGNSDLVSIPENDEPKVVPLSVEVFNQLNTTDGLSQTAQRWELTEEIEGITIDETTGELTLNPGVQAESLGVRVTLEPDYAGAPSEPFVFEKTLKVIPFDPIASTNMLSNADFEEGHLNGWISNWQPGIKLTDADAYSGTYSALTAGKPAGTNVSYLPVTLEANKRYLFSTMVKLVKENVKGALTFHIYAGSIERPYSDAETINPNHEEWTRIIGTVDNPKAKPVESFISVTEWYHPEADFYTDDYYVGMLRASMTYTGKKDCDIPGEGKAANRVKLTTEFKNQFGNRVGLTEATVTRWELAEEYPGVSVVNDNGADYLVVTERANAQKIKITAVFEDERIYNNGCTRDVEIDLIGNGETNPRAYDVKISGVVGANKPLDGNYLYYQLNNEAQEGTKIEWCYSDELNGTYVPMGIEDTLNCIIPAEYGDKYIRMEVTPKSETGKTGKTYVSNILTRPLPPFVTNITVSGDSAYKETLVADYKYWDDNFDPEGTSLFRWLKCDTVDGTYTPIDNQTSKSLYLTEDLKDMYIKFEVTPVATVEPYKPYDGKVFLSQPIYGPTVPEAKNVSIKELPNGKYAADYTYYHKNGILQDETICKWYLDDELIHTGESCKVTSNGKLKLVVTPVAQKAPFEGAEVSTSIKVSSGGGGGSSGGGGSISFGGNSIVTVPTPPAPVTPPAQPQKHWASDAIDFVIKENIMQNKAENDFKVNDLVTRGEFISYIMDMLKFEKTKYNNCFADITADMPYADAVETAVKLGIISKDEKFYPDRDVSREEICKILALSIAQVKEIKDGNSVNIEKFSDSSQVSSWATQYVKAMVESGFLKGVSETEFMPKGKFTRAQTAVTLQRIYNYIK